MTSYELYRKSSIGMSLTEALDELVTNGNLSPLLAVKVLMQFDKSMNDALAQKVKSKTNFKGHLHTYRFCDNVWTFILEQGKFKTDNDTIEVDRGSCNVDTVDGCVVIMPPRFAGYPPKDRTHSQYV